MSTGKVAGGGILGIIVAVAIAYFTGGDPTAALVEGVQQQMQAKTETVGEQEFTAEEQELAEDCKKIMASTEDVWTKVFQDNGWASISIRRWCCSPTR